MSELRVFEHETPETPLMHTTDAAEIATLLGQVGVRFEQWRIDATVEVGSDQETVLDAYRSDIDRLIHEAGYQTVDAVSLTPEHPDKDALRQKFLSEHRHTEDEVRFFVAGRGLFSLHIDERVYEVLCEQGDLISVPGNTPHWFDMGPAPRFTAIRLFNDPAGWVAHYTGSDIAERFSRLED